MNQIAMFDNMCFVMEGYNLHQHAVNWSFSIHYLAFENYLCDALLS